MTIIHGDCREVLAGWDEACVDSVVTDPPYGLGFMGKAWDAKFIDGTIEKRRQYAGDPSEKSGENGGYRSAAAEAGRYDLSLTGNQGFGAWCEQWASECLRTLKPGGHLVAFGGARTYHRLCCAIEDAGFEIRDQIMWLYGSGFPKSKNLPGGLGTALKPAHEPIVLARKPLAGTVAGNVEVHGTGALRIDECRVAFASGEDEAESKTKNQHAQFGSGPMTNRVFGEFSKDRDDYDATGRWPANVIHDGSEEVLAGFPEGSVTGKRTDASKERFSAASPLPGSGESNRKVTEYTDAGSAARFFYCAKASKKDRGEDNKHPTVKPTELMRHLCRLVTPAGGLILDPFAGSGSTGKAAVLEGFRFAGVELDENYVQIARARTQTADREMLEALLA